MIGGFIGLAFGWLWLLVGASAAGPARVPVLVGGSARSPAPDGAWSGDADRPPTGPTFAGISLPLSPKSWRS